MGLKLNSCCDSLLLTARRASSQKVVTRVFAPNGRCAEVPVAGLDHLSRQCRDGFSGITANSSQGRIMSAPGIERLHAPPATGEAVGISRRDPATVGERIRRALQREMPGDGCLSVDRLAEVVDGKRRS